MTHDGGFGGVVGAREGLTEDDIDSAGREAKGAGVAVGAGEGLLQLDLAGVGEIGECGRALGDKHDWSSAHFHDGEGRNSCTADGVLAFDVERQNVSLTGAAGVAALDRESDVV